MTSSVASSPPLGTQTTQTTQEKPAATPQHPGEEMAAWMKSRGVDPTLEAFVDLNWGGEKTVEEVLAEPELASQIPPSLMQGSETEAPTQTGAPPTSTPPQPK